MKQIEPLPASQRDLLGQREVYAQLSASIDFMSNEEAVDAATYAAIASKINELVHAVNALQTQNMMVG